MAGEIIWTFRAKIELIEILNYWLIRNQSNTFSKKLNNLIISQLNLIIEYPKIGRKTDIPNVYVKVIKDYLLYYEFIGSDLYILTIRHGKKDTKTLKIKSN